MAALSSGVRPVSSIEPVTLRHYLDLPLGMPLVYIVCTKIEL
jgi:hypothetical protein